MTLQRDKKRDDFMITTLMLMGLELEYRPNPIIPEIDAWVCKYKGIEVSSTTKGEIAEKMLSVLGYWVLADAPYELVKI
jgi:hypothetical protein